MPAFSLRMTFSQISASAVTSARSGEDSDNPPVFKRSLWQVTQYRSRTGRNVAGS